ncbi:MAG: GcvT family protein, partial [Streptosporangiaceae bacterium]
MTHPRVVIIGAGIVGCAVADELTARGWSEVTLVDQGPVYETGGSTTHAPGLVFQTNGSKTMTEFARYTVAKYSALRYRGRPCFAQLGGIEVAGSPERWADLKRKHGWATSWGVEGYLRSPGECVALDPLLDPDQIYGGFHVPSDGLAKAVWAAEIQAGRAVDRGGRVLAHHHVTGVETAHGHVTGVVTDRGVIPCDAVVSCAGMWGPRVGAMVGMTAPLVPMAHQYATTGAVPALAGQTAEASRPILRHQDRDMYLREHGDRIGIGAYGHRPMPLAVDDILAYDDALVMPSVTPFTEDDFEPWWQEARALLPALQDAKVEEGINGLFSFTPDGAPLLGEHRDLAGFWVAEAVWITHSAGVAKAVAEWLIDGQPRVDVHECDVNRFDELRLAPSYVHKRSVQSFVEVYDIIHPLQPMDDPRPLRTSPFYGRERDLGAFFLEANGWERPHWYEANASLLDRYAVPGRAAWAARYWSPIAGAEARATRDGVALYDMTSLKRLEVTGPGAEGFLQRLTTNNVAKPPGRVTYTLLLGEDGGVRSDLTVARVADELFQVGCNGELDLDWFVRHLPGDGSVGVRDITYGTCCVGVWGPLARDLVQPLTAADLSREGLRYFRCTRAYIGEVPVLALRLSYVGELGWELYTSADLGPKLWDTLWRAG